ncbi:TetR/AcrR family transcriptional regulator [Euzebya tangerina]|uniref:TetR/AcrR family transcriptional regulator n=1 Tax=Euzebya tangerina TaxID=591198 RepID=UPI0013C31433|nr:TetR/AcrR family transcriptional regulator [Euzebya tangerina]
MAPPTKLDRAGIVDVALQLVDDEGYDALGVRAVARRLDVAPNALARHVGDLETLRGHAAERVFRELLHHVEDARTRVTGPVESTIAIATGYFGYAVTRPARWPLVAIGAKGPSGKAGYASLVDNVAAALTDERDPVQVAMAVWGVAHGTAGLVNEGALDAAIAARAVRAAVRGILLDDPATTT